MARRKLGRAAIEVGAGRGGSGRGVGNLAGVAGGGQHPRQRHAELVGHDLCHLGVQSLAHFGAPVVHLHAAVQVHMNQRAGLVEQGGGERNTEFDRRYRQPASYDGLASVPSQNSLPPLLVLRSLL